jgi:hypothetical protein
LRFTIISLLIFSWLFLKEIGYDLSMYFYILSIVIQLYFFTRNGDFYLNKILLLLIFCGVAHLFFGLSYYNFVFVIIYITIALVSGGTYTISKSNFAFVNLFLCLTFCLSMSKIDLVFNFSFGSFLTSDFSSWENNSHPFIFLLFFIYAVNFKYNILAFVNFIFILISFKRIVFFAAVIYFIFFFFNLLRLNLIKNLLKYSHGILIFIPYIINYPLIVDAVYDLTGLYMTHLTQGRSMFYSEITNTFSDPCWMILGYGPGKVTEWSVENNDYLIHNDLLKLFLEFGLLVYLYFFNYLYHKIQKSLYLVLILLFLTDNVFIYSYFMIFLFIFNDALKSEC